MMRFKDAFVIRLDYGHRTGYGLNFADDVSGQELRLGIDFGEYATLSQVAGFLKELAKKCDDMALSEKLVRALDEEPEERKELQEGDVKVVHEGEIVEEKDLPAHLRGGKKGE